MKKGVFLLIIVIIAITSIFVLFNSKTSFKMVKNEYYNITYDNTWKLIDNSNEVKLEHKRSKAILSIQYKVLDINYNDTSLDDIIGNIMYSIEEQNIDYKLLEKSKLDNKYDAYSYLYENDSSNTLVNVYKKDNILIIVYYEAEFKYYDIVLDSVDTILDSLEIKIGE